MTDCAHVWSKWSKPVKDGFYHWQHRTCKKCGKVVSRHVYIPAEKKKKRRR